MADVFTEVGLQRVTDYFDGTANAPANWYYGWGTGTNAASVNDTTLQTESAESRVTATESQPTSTQNRLIGTITSAGSQTITEAGIFDASTTGNMVVRSVFSGIAVVSGDSITFTTTITWDQA